MASQDDIAYLENSIDRTSSRLSFFEQKLSNLENLDEFNDIDDACVLELLESMTEVQNEYMNLRNNIKEVRKLQTEMSSSIRLQMRSLQQTFKILKKRIQLNKASRH